MLYNDTDYKEVNTTMRKFIIQFLVATVIYVAIFVLSCLFRIAWPGYVFGCLWAVYAVFSWGMIGSRIRKYRHFLRDIAIGLDREILGTVDSIDEDVCVRQGLEFYAIDLILSKSDPKDPGRRIYYDAAKGRPPFEIGEEVRLLLFGNFLCIVYKTCKL